MTTFSTPSLEVADIFRNFDNLLGKIPLQHHKVIQAIKNCRTNILGGHFLKCNHCDFKKKAYNSCRSRFCPKCQYLTQVKWVEQRCEELLPCEYFHVVFTIPSEYNPLVLRNKDVCYNILFKATSLTLKKVTAMTSGSEAEMGCIGVLHTWSQNLLDHPHCHYIVPGGTLNKKRTKWVKCSENFLLPIKMLSITFNKIFSELMENAFDGGKLQFAGDIEYLSHYANFRELLSTCKQKDWVVYCKKPFAGARQVLSYLGRYTHRIAISNYRLVKVVGDRVHFKVRDSKKPGEQKEMSLHVHEFMRRFLLHILPKGFVKIRYFGLLGNRYKQEKIKVIRKLNNIVESLNSVEDESWKDLLKRIDDIDVDLCPNCKVGYLSITGEIPSLFDTA